MSFFKYLNSCVNCGFIANSKTTFCNKCQRLLLSKINQQCASLLSVHPFRVNYLLEWDGRGDEKIIYSLKQSPHIQAFEFVASQMCTRFSGLWSKEGSILLVVAPTAREGINHSRQLAEAIGGQLPRAQIYDSLNKAKAAGTQKKKSKMERRKIKIEDKGLADCTKFKKVVFVDDLVTTGSTALAAFEALGRPSNYEVWSIYYRREFINIRSEICT